MHAQLNNICSTKSKPSTPLLQHTPTTKLNLCTKIAYPACEPITGKISTDQTGNYLAQLSSSYNYLFILYVYNNNNYICAYAIPLYPKFHILCSLKKTIALLK